MVGFYRSVPFRWTRVDARLFHPARGAPSANSVRPAYATCCPCCRIGGIGGKWWIAAVSLCGVISSRAHGPGDTLRTLGSMAAPVRRIAARSSPKARSMPRLICPDPGGGDLATENRREWRSFTSSL